METDPVHRYHSRILREMNANRANPFNSPPSSTGSHGTISPTLSSVLTDPEGESTRRLNDDIARVTAPRKLPVNWEAAHRKWPDFYSRPKPVDEPAAGAAVGSRSSSSQSKENRPPPPAAAFADDSTQDLFPGPPPPPASEPDSDLLSHYSNSPPLSRQPLDRNRPPNPRKQNQAPGPSSKSDPSQPSHRRSSATAASALSREKPSLSPSRHDRDSPHGSSAKSSLTAVAASPDPAPTNVADGSLLQSFIMPDVSHLGDFVTGTLRFSGSMKNGVPIFVKHGRVHDHQEKPFVADHAIIDGIEVPEDEEKIFVSMDMIRHEIVTLQEHHDKVQQYAHHLQQQVDRLESQLKSGNQDQGGVDSDGINEKHLVARKKELEIEVTTLQTQLNKATQKITTHEVEKISLAHERDRAISRLQSACEDISKLTRKLGVKEKKLETSQKQLETTEQTRQENDTLRRDLLSLKHGREALEHENMSLQKENEALREDLKKLLEENQSLRSHHRNRRGDEPLLSENKSLRSVNKTLSGENEELREGMDEAQHELDAVREEVDRLRRQVDTAAREKSVFQQDNESLVRQNEKYFTENKTLRRERSELEHSIHEAQEEKRKLQEELDFVKQQLDHCRPLPNRDDDFSARLDEETEENMTSAFFVPDITINTNESAAAEANETKEIPAPGGDDQGPAEIAHDIQDGGHQKQKMGRSKSAPRGSQAAHGQRVAFSIPANSAQGDKNMANKGSKRRNPTAKSSHQAGQKKVAAQMDELTGEADDTTGRQSLDLGRVHHHYVKDQQSTRHRSHVVVQGHRSGPARSSAPSQPQPHPMTETTDPRPACPALSLDARRILEGLCEHNCRNCIVCSRIVSHQGVVSSAELAAGKKRVTVRRPVPVTDRDLTANDPTIRPSQSPGHALALVIKGLEDEVGHLQAQLSALQADYNGSDKALGRRDRLGLADGIRTLLKKLEVKNDQIYSLYDVLEGQKAAGQAMSEDEIELTVLNITGMTVRDLTAGSDQLTSEAIREFA